MEEYLSVREVAETLHVKPITIRRWIKQGVLPAIFLGKTNLEYRIAKKELDKFLEERRVVKK